MFHNITDGVPARYSLNPEGQICITFTDPAYVRSDLIIYDRKDSSVHAVMSEGLHLIGHVEGDLKKTFAQKSAGKSEVILIAPHYFSGTLNLKTPLVISN